METKRHIYNIRIITLLLLMMIGWGSVNAEVVTFTAANEKSYGNGSSVTTGTGDSNISFAFGNSKYYTTGESVRIYSNGYMIITAINGYTITNIVITFSETKSSFTPDKGEYSLSSKTGTWTGKSDCITFTNNASSGYAGVQKVVVTYQPDITLKNLAITGELTKTNYTVDDTFSFTGLSATGTKDDDTTIDLTTGVKWSVEPSVLRSTTTSVIVKATYGVITATAPYNVTVTNEFSTTIGALTVTSDKINNDITYEALQGTSNNKPINTTNKCLRLYENGGYVIIKGTSNRIKIQSITITTSAEYDSTTVGCCVDNGTPPTTGQTVNKSSEYKIENLNNNEVKIYCLGTSSTTCLDIAAITVSYIKEDVESTLTIPIAAACTDGTRCYSTYSSSKAFYVPENLTVSEIGITDGRLNVQPYATGAVVPANTGVMVSATEGGNYSVAIASDATDATSVLGSNNCLKATGDSGISADQMNTGTASGTLFYRLTMHNGTQIGYWWGAENGAAFAIAANKAYLEVPQSASVKTSMWFDSDVTSISPLLTNLPTNATYNLSGQRITDTSRKGIYIMNGKKYVAK